MTDTNSCSAVYPYPWELDLVKVVVQELFFGACRVDSGCLTDAKHLPSALQVPLERVR